MTCTNLQSVSGDVQPHGCACGLYKGVELLRVSGDVLPHGHARARGPSVSGDVLPHVALQMGGALTLHK